MTITRCVWEKEKSRSRYLTLHCTPCNQSAAFISNPLLIYFYKQLIYIYSFNHRAVVLKNHTRLLVISVKDNTLKLYCKPIFPQADRDFVAKKIQKLRGSVRKEFRKVDASKRSGKGAEDVYVPSLWYYDLLTFTKDQDTPSASVSNIEEDSNQPLDEVEARRDEPELEEIEVQAADADADDMDDTDTQPQSQDEEVQLCESTNKRPAGEMNRCVKKKKRMTA